MILFLVIFTKKELRFLMEFNRSRSKQNSIIITPKQTISAISKDVLTIKTIRTLSKTIDIHAI